MLPVATSLVANDQSTGMFGWFPLHSTLCDDHGVPFIPHPAQFSSLPVRSILEPQHTCKSIWYSFPCNSSSVLTVHTPGRKIAFCSTL